MLCSLTGDTTVKCRHSKNYFPRNCAPHCCNIASGTNVILDEIALIVARMDSLMDRCEMLLARFFKKQLLASNALPVLHYLLLELRDNDTICRLRNSQPFPSIRACTTKFHKSFLPFGSKILQVHCDFVLYFIVLMF